jgi:elongation factor Ts
VAMQIAAASPVCLTSDKVPAELLEKEKEIYRAQALESGKPEKVIDKIVEGRVKKLFSEVCLMEQPYVKNPDVSITDLLNELVAKLGESINVRRFVRYQLGEELPGEETADAEE